MNELITKESESVKRFLQSLDRLMNALERMTKDYRPVLGGERYLSSSNSR